jgi:putative tryptophan/tyrosine transport system substrate-binding protein
MTILRVTRRSFVAALGGAAAWPVVARGQDHKLWGVGYLSPAGGESGVALFNVFIGKMQDLGYVVGKNLHVDLRNAEGDYSRLPALAVEIVSLAPDVIVGANSAAAAALQRATSSIPIVMGTTGDPIGDGLIKSFAKPGGNITGMSSQSAELTAKALELLHVAVPNAKRIAVLTSPAPQHKLMLKDAFAAAGSLGLQIMPVMARTPDDFNEAFATMHTENCEAVLVLADPRILRKLVELSDQWRLPAIYQATGFVDMGGMLSYSANTSELFRGAALYVDKILKGAKPADLPVEQPTRFELQVNLKTAGALGITIPDSILARADEVIE